ncbi:hypothetical protein [Pseudomonas sp. KNUC1026]|uniref:hypothetical protein n=1 Tax=Pseudomonas sp. KNUC1026 TaxID=2893890 RepID=UPI001F351501|nr:hypothetical protein [Pseudomonas sp. KNUC1026]UFH51196.1 hypothetical protein LN139_09250 [Pseudomonas sp. KNUC1026]
MYGDGFADFLNSLPAASELPYLADVARLDRLWIESFAANIEPALDVAALAEVPPEALGALVLQPRPSARWQWFASLPIFTLWYYNREGRELPDPIQWQGEGALLIGDVNGVAAHPIHEASALFLDACRRQVSLDQACEFVQRTYPDTDFNHLLGQLLAARAFAAIDPSSRTA